MMRFAFCVLLLLLTLTAGLAFRPAPNGRHTLLRHTATRDSQFDTPLRTSEGAKMYLPHGDILDEELLMNESDKFVAFNGMNSNTHVQIDKTTWAAPKKIAGRPTVLKHLYRYFTDICVDCWLSTVQPIDFLLSCNYTKSDIADMEKAFPRFMSLDVKAHLSPHVRFIVRTLGAGTGDICDGQECSIDGEGFIPHNLLVSQLGKTTVPPIFFGKRLEKTIGPRHAYLVHYGLPHGKELLENDGRLFQEFLDACDTPPQIFAHLCNEWSLHSQGVGPFSPMTLHTPGTVEAFELAFHRGLLDAAQNIPSPELELVGCSPGRMVDLLLQHGANAIEHDRFGCSMLHWAAGTGNLNGAYALLKFLIEAGEGEDATEILLNTRGAKDGATPLHWASCGVESSTFGVGGHENICQLFLNEAGDRAAELVNVECFSGSTPIMWAAWSGSLDVVKLLSSYGADHHKVNQKGGNVAHWAAAGGNLDVCRFLHDELSVNFNEECEECNTPLYYAELCGHDDVAKWIKTQS